MSLALLPPEMAAFVTGLHIADLLLWESRKGPGSPSDSSRGSLLEDLREEQRVQYTLHRMASSKIFIRSINHRNGYIPIAFLAQGFVEVSGDCVRSCVPGETFRKKFGRHYPWNNLAGKNLWNLARGYSSWEVMALWGLYLEANLGGLSRQLGQFTA
jgi:hypothetical protein